MSAAWLEGYALKLLGGSIHGWFGDAILWLAGVHALAAIYHHFVLNDRVLRSMLPSWLVRVSLMRRGDALRTRYSGAVAR